MKSLIIEDDAVTRDLLTSSLSTLGEVAEAPDGGAGFLRFCEAADSGVPFSLVLIDIMMPHVDGISCLQAIRDFEKARKTTGNEAARVIMLTGLSDREYVRNVHREFDVDYLVKPISHRDILELVQGSSS